MSRLRESYEVPLEVIEKDNFDRLPDELVVIIFSLLCPEDIVCNVARVCTRWRNIAKDPKVWKFSCLMYTYAHLKQFKLVIRFAPFLAKLKVNWYVPHHEDMNAILTGCPNVKSLQWSPSIDDERGELLQCLIKILQHLKSTLQEVDIYVNYADVPTSSGNTNKNDLLFSIFSILSSMESLKSLRLRGSLSPWMLGQDLFEHGWRSLECLDLLSFNNKLSIASLHHLNQQFVLNILKHKAHSLRRLVLSQKMFSLHSDHVFHNVFKSSSLEALRICESSLLVVKNLEVLKELHVMGLSDKDLSVWRSSLTNPEQYERMFDWIRCSSQFSNIKHLILDNMNDDDRGLVRNIFAVCRSLESLTLYGGNYTSGQLMWMLKDLRALRRLCVHRVSSFNSRHLKLIPTCHPNLLILDLRCCVFTRDGIFMDYEETVQTKMPNLKLYTDSGYFDKRGAKLFASMKKPKAVAIDDKLNDSFQKMSHIDVTKMLDEYSDYDDSDS